MIQINNYPIPIYLVNILPPLSIIIYDYNQVISEMQSIITF